MGRRCLTTSTLFCGLTTGLGLNLCLARTTGLLPPTGSSVRPSGLGSSSASCCGCCGCCWASTAPQAMADTARIVASLDIVSDLGGSVGYCCYLLWWEELSSFRSRVLKI